MRAQLFNAGFLVAGLGALLYLLGLVWPQTYVDINTGMTVTVPAVPLVFSVPFIVAGAGMILASPFLKPSDLPVKPPPGFKFCLFCSTAIPEDAKRCPKCDGVQPD